MTQERLDFTEAQFEPVYEKPEDFWGGFLVLMIVGALIAYGNLPSFLPDFWFKGLIEGFIAGFGRFVQIFAVHWLAESVVVYARHGVCAKSGKYEGNCPYCGTPNRIFVAYPNKIKRQECSNCKNRFVVRDGRFHRLKHPSPLCARFPSIKNGIDLLLMGKDITFGMLSILLVTFLLSQIIESRLWSVIPYAVFIPTLGSQIWSLWLFFLQGSARIYGRNRRWIILGLCLQHITLALLIHKLAFWNDWRIDCLLCIISPIGQFALLTFLIDLCNLLQRPDLGTEFEDTLINTLLIFGALIVKPLLSDSYELPLLIFYGTLGLGVLFIYYDSLQLLATHINTALGADK